jgi:hypothetical protein
MQSAVPGFPPEAYERELIRAMERAEEQRHHSLRRRQLRIEGIRTLDVLNAVLALHVLNTTRGRQWVDEGLGYIDIHRELGSLSSTQEIDAAEENAQQVMNDAVRLASGPWNDGHLHELRTRFPECNDSNLGGALDHAYWLTR